MKKPLATLGALGLGAALWGHFEAGWVRLADPGADPGAARGAGRAARRAPVRLPPRLPVARGGRGRTRDRVDGRARSRSGRDHRRPPLATCGRGQAAGAPRASARVVRGPRQPRLRLVARPVLQAERGLRPPLDDGALRRGEDGRAPRSKRPDRRRRPAHLPARLLAPSRAGRPGRGPAHPALPLSERDRPHSARDVDLVLAGHLHAGQIVVPYGRGKVRFAHLRWTYAEGLYRRPGGVLHVSPGLGTTFVPFRFFARPEATELVLGSVP